MIFSIHAFLLLGSLLPCINALMSSSSDCFSVGRPCDFQAAISNTCDRNTDFLEQQKCMCKAGYIPLRQACQWCQKSYPDFTRDKEETAYISSISSNCAAVSVSIAPIPSGIISAMAAYNATQTREPTKGSNSVQDTKAKETSTRAETYGSLLTRTYYGGGDATPSAWRTQTAPPEATKTDATSSASRFTLDKNIIFVGLISAMHIYFVSCIL